MEKMTLAKREQLRRDLLLKGLEGDKSARWLFDSNMCHDKREWYFFAAYIMRNQSDFYKKESIIREEPRRAIFKAMELTKVNLESNKLLSYLNIMERYVNKWEHDEYNDTKQLHEHLRKQLSVSEMFSPL